MKFGKLILRKVIEIIATKCQILRLKCTKIDFRPYWGSLQRSPRPPSWNKKREGEWKGNGKGKGKERRRGMGRKGEVREGRGRGAENGMKKGREGKGSRGKGRKRRKGRGKGTRHTNFNLLPKALLP